MLFREVLAIVLEREGLILDKDRRLRRSSVIGILEELREDMSRALNLLEELVPRACKLWILFQLVPPLRSPLANALEICWLGVQLGSPVLPSSSEKS
jgi:hypothetical protein